jgi:hypothetical protein
MLATIEDLGLKIGDRSYKQQDRFLPNSTVAAVSGGGLSANQFTASEAISVG